MLSWNHIYFLLFGNVNTPIHTIIDFGELPCCDCVCLGTFRDLVLMSPKSSHVEEVLPFSLGRNWLMSPLQSLKGVGGHCLSMFSLVRNGTWLRSRCAQGRACFLLVWEGRSHGPSAFMCSPVCWFNGVQQFMSR